MLCYTRLANRDLNSDIPEVSHDHLSGPTASIVGQEQLENLYEASSSSW